MSIIKDMKGLQFGYLTVIDYAGSNKNGRAIWICKCKCGKIHETLGKYLRDGSATSCGCRKLKILADTTKRQTTHGMSNTRLYQIWQGIRGRCNNPNDESYYNYGGRKIRICKDWDEFINFYYWAINNGYSEGLTIDRINSNGNYDPDNCRWADYKTQGNNTRRNHKLTYKGITKTMAEWAELKGIKYSTLRGRINIYHWSVEKALETPVRPLKRRNYGKDI